MLGFRRDCLAADQSPERRGKLLLFEGVEGEDDDDGDEAWSAADVLGAVVDESESAEDGRWRSSMMQIMTKRIDR